jgi:hypothetical protein
MRKARVPTASVNAWPSPSCSPTCLSVMATNSASGPPPSRRRYSANARSPSVSRSLVHTVSRLLGSLSDTIFSGQRSSPVVRRSSSAYASEPTVLLSCAHSRQRSLGSNRHAKRIVPPLARELHTVESPNGAAVKSSCPLSLRDVRASSASPRPPGPTGAPRARGHTATRAKSWCLTTRNKRPKGGARPASSARAACRSRRGSVISTLVQL